MTVGEALSRLVDAVDVSAYDEELNVLREAIDAQSTDDTDSIKSELEEVKEALSQKESAYSDLEAKYKARFKELIESTTKGVEEAEKDIIDTAAKEPDRPMTFADLSLTAETE